MSCKVAAAGVLQQSLILTNIFCSKIISINTKQITALRRHLMSISKLRMSHKNAVAAGVLEEGDAGRQEAVEASPKTRNK